MSDPNDPVTQELADSVLTVTLNTAPTSTTP